VKLTGTGVWSHHLRYGDASESAEAAAELDKLGYSAMWIPDVGGDVLGSVEHLLGAAPRIAVATGILNVWMHEASEVAHRRASWSSAWQQRFLLGLGVSHAVLIDHGNPGRYNKPFSKMVEFLDGLDAAEVPYPADARVLAALRPKMLGLARERAAGVHPYFVPVEHVARARETLGPNAMIGVELAVVLDTDPTTARETARKHTAVYTSLPNYTNNLLNFGFTESDFADRGNDRLVDAIVAWGSIDTIAKRVAAMRDAGADHVCIQVIRPDDDIPLADWRELAPALIEG
jgi:probable F420-dependent oxidoreductase